MSLEIAAALIGVGGTLLAVLFGHWLQASRKSDSSKSNETSASSILPSSSGLDRGALPKRYLDQPHHVRFVKSLPELKKLNFDSARKGWDSGITAEMAQASAEVIDFMGSVWAKLAEFYPEKHFGGELSQEYIRNYILSRSTYHMAKHEASGPGSHGTSVRVLGGSDVIKDLDQMIVDLVRTLAWDTKSIDFEAWEAAWVEASR